MQHDNPWHTLSTENVYHDEWITLMKDEVVTPEGQPGSYTYIEAADCVLVLLINSSEQIYLEWTYRYPTKSWGWELPGGGLDTEAPLDNAKRELAEETGYVAEDWQLLGNPTVHSGLVTASMNIYLARDIRNTGIVASDDNEITDTGRFFSLGEIKRMILAAELTDSQTIAAIYFYDISRETE